VLRRSDATFTIPDDPNAAVVVDAYGENTFLDINVQNGTPYFYALFSWDGAIWTRSAAVSATPAFSYAHNDADPQCLVRDRVALGLAAELAAGNLEAPSGNIQVLTAPYALFEGVTMPVVSVHLQSQSAGDHALGDLVASDGDLSCYGLSLGEDVGVFQRTTLQIVGIALNSDQRLALRRALERVILGNLSVFYANNLTQVEWSFSDDEDFAGENVNLFRTVCAFSCVSQTALRNTAIAPPASGITVNLGVVE
jgi:hypothetical protein